MFLPNCIAESERGFVWKRNYSTVLVVLVVVVVVVVVVVYRYLNAVKKSSVITIIVF